MCWGVLTQSVPTFKPGFTLSNRPRSIITQSSASRQSKRTAHLSCLLLKLIHYFFWIFRQSSNKRAASQLKWIRKGKRLDGCTQWGIEWQPLERKALMDEWLLRRCDRKRCDGMMAVCHLKKQLQDSINHSYFLSVATYKHRLTNIGLSTLFSVNECVFTSPLPPFLDEGCH